MVYLNMEKALRKMIRSALGKGKTLPTREELRVLEAAGLAALDTKGTYKWSLTDEGLERGLSLVKYKAPNPDKLIRRVLESPLFSDSESPLSKWVYRPGTSRLALVLGDNASGKSFFRRWLTTVAKRPPFNVPEVFSMNMQLRGSVGIESAIAFGDEAWQATGGISAKALLTLLSTATGRKNRLILYLDEPDVGMSASTAAGAGVAIRNFVGSWPNPLVDMVVLTTHSAALVRQLADLDPYYVYLGAKDGPATVDDWLAAQEDPEPVNLDDVVRREMETFRAIQRYIKRFK